MLLWFGMLGFAAGSTTGSPHMLAASFRNPHSLMEPEDYPAEAVRRHEQGRPRVAITVDPSGKFVSCTVTQPSGSTLLDEAGCRILRQRARLRPAMIDGKPVHGVLTTVTSFLLFPDGVVPTDPPPSADVTINRPEILDGRRSSEVVINRHMSAAGSEMACEVATSSGNDLYDALACRQAGRAPIETIRDRSGVAVEGVLTEVVLFR